MKFIKTNYPGYSYASGCVVCRISEDGDSVTIDGYLEFNEVVTLMEKMKEVMNEKEKSKERAR